VLDLPIDPPSATSGAPHGSPDFDRSRLKVLFAHPHSHTAVATGAAIVTSAYRLDPLTVAHLDMAARRMTAVDDPPHHVRWGDIPPPFFGGRRPWGGGRGLYTFGGPREITFDVIGVLSLVLASCATIPTPQEANDDPLHQPRLSRHCAVTVGNGPE